MLLLVSSELGQVNRDDDDQDKIRCDKISPAIPPKSDFTLFPHNSTNHGLQHPLSVSI